MPVHAWSALYTITEFPGLRSKDIQHLFPRPQNSISRVVRLLIDRNLVEEEVSSTDARAKLLYATDKGAELLKEIKAKALARQAEMLGSLDTSEREIFEPMFENSRRSGPASVGCNALTAKRRRAQPNGRSHKYSGFFVFNAGAATIR